MVSGGGHFVKTSWNIIIYLFVIPAQAGIYCFYVFLLKVPRHRRGGAQRRGGLWEKRNKQKTTSRLWRTPPQEENLATFLKLKLSCRFAALRSHREAQPRQSSL